MQAQQLSTSGRPALAATGSASPALASSSSPFISLSTQCDALYRIGAQPHSYAFLSEQSVFARAAEQLRFWTPSPLQPQTAEASAPHIRVVAPPAPPFPSLSVLEQARVTEAKALAAAQQRGHTAASSSLTALSKPLVSSGASVARDAFHADYPASRRSSVHDTSDDAVVASTTAAQDLLTGVSAVPMPSPTPPTMTGPAPLHLPSHVLVRSVAQMVLTMQTSQQSSAAKFALARYRGVSLPAWHEAVQQSSSSLAALITPPASPEALVFSVLPQVVADRCAKLPPSTGSADFYALSPCSTVESVVAPSTAGRKHQRAEAGSSTADVRSPPEAFTEPPIVPGAVSCTRISGATVSASAGLSLSYTEADPDTFDELSSSSLDGTPLTKIATLLHTSEAAWLTHGVLRPLFSFPGLPQPTVPEDPPTEEQRRSTHAAFIKTSAFLFLAFLVHHSWCRHIHDALATRLTRGGAVTLEGMQTTCLPDLTVGRRSPQHAWRSVLTYRLLQRTRGEDSKEKEEVGAATLFTGDSGTSATVVVGGELTVVVVNRSAELTWRYSGAHGGVDASLTTESLISSAGALKGSGFLDELLERL